MKAKLFVTLLALALLSARPGRAQTADQNEFQRLKEQHEQAVAAALRPLQHSYRTAMEQLMRKAVSDGDLEATAKVVEALKTLPPDESAAKATPVGMPNPALAARIEALLTGATWVHQGKYHYRFTKGGLVSLKEPHPRGHYKIDDRTGHVSFQWDGNQFPNEGLNFDAASGTFRHMDGGAFVPVHE